MTRKWIMKLTESFFEVEVLAVWNDQLSSLSPSKPDQEHWWWSWQSWSAHNPKFCRDDMLKKTNMCNQYSKDLDICRKELLSCSKNLSKKFFNILLSLIVKCNSFFWRTVGYQHQNIYSRRLVFPFGLEAIKPLQLVGQVAEFKFESKFEPLLPCLSSGNISGSACSGLSSPALLARIGWASTNTGRSQVGCSRCWPRLACLRKTCYYSCNSYSVQE